MVEREVSVVLSGSFRKHLAEIHRCIRAFDELGVRVVAPRLATAKNPGEEFVILDGDETDDPCTLEQAHLDAISEADALFLVSVDGYVGASASLEVGWALSRGKRVFALEAPKDVTLRAFVEAVGEPPEIALALRAATEPALDALGPGASLAQVQATSHALVVKRGFDDETPMEIVLLMVEEVGELAKAVRKEVGLKVDAAKLDEIPRIRTELADVFIYLLHLADRCHVDLFEAWIEKERLNETRFFERAGS